MGSQMTPWSSGSAADVELRKSNWYGQLVSKFRHAIMDQIGRLMESSAVSWAPLGDGQLPTSRLVVADIRDGAIAFFGTQWSIEFDEAAGSVVLSPAEGASLTDIRRAIKAARAAA